MIRIFSDFDGTITEEDMILSFLKKLDPPGWREIVGEIMNKQLTQGEGLRRLYQIIPSAVFSELLFHILDTVEIRTGFGEFVDYCQERDFALHVISGGLEDFVRPIVEPYGVTSVWANQIGREKEFLELQIPFLCDAACEGNGQGTHCAPCKPSIIRNVAENGDLIIVIGDSVSDIQMAKIAHHVFARGHLLEVCQTLHLPYTAYETFYDVIEGVEDVTANL